MIEVSVLIASVFAALWFADDIAEAIARLFPRVSDDADKAIRDALKHTRSNAK